MNVFVIILVVAIVTVGILYLSAKNAQEVKEEEPKFQPRKVTIVVSDTEKPKRKKRKKYYNKPNKSTAAQNAQVEKRPVGRPRKAQ